MADTEARSFPEILEGEFVDPHVLHAAESHPLPTGAGDATIQLTAAQVLARAGGAPLPGWVRDLPLSARVRVREAFRRIGFDLRRRLDEDTFVAANPEGGERPLLVLQLARPGVDLTRIDLFQLELAAADLVVVDPDRIQALDDEPLLRAVAVRLEDLPHAVTRYRPGLVLRERLRLVLAFAGFELGGPISMLTLLPGERRSVRVVRKSRSRVEQSSELGLETRDTQELTRGLERQFRRGWEQRRDRKRLRGLVWSRREAAQWKPGGAVAAASAREGSDDREEAWSLESSTVREVLDRAARSTGREVERVRVHELLRERIDETERTEVVELENGLRDRALTYAAHHVLAAYQAHLDLVDVELHWLPEEPEASPGRLDLRGDWRSALRALPDAASGLGDQVAGLLRSRLGALDALVGDGPRLRPVPPDAANLDLVSRDLMLSPDRRERRGPLPVCLLSRQLAVRTGGTFVRTYAAGHPAEPSGSKSADSTASAGPPAGSTSARRGRGR